MSDRRQKVLPGGAQLDPQAANQFYLRRADVLVEIVQERYSCRAFLPVRVPSLTIETMVLTAQRSASWQNTQPWEVVVTGVNATHRLRAMLIQHAITNKPKPDLAPPTLEGVHKLRSESFRDLHCGTKSLPPDSTGSGQDELHEELRFFGAPHLALVTAPKKLGSYGILDCGAYICNFMLAAQSMGVSTIAQTSLAGYPDFWREQIALSSNRLVLCAISFGYENADHPANRLRTPRVPTGQTVTWLNE